MKRPLLVLVLLLFVTATGVVAVTRPPGDAPAAFRSYCAGRCHLSPTSIFSPKRAAFEAWGELSEMDRELRLCTMGLELYAETRRGIPLEDHRLIMEYLNRYFDPDREG